ncbi:MAG: FAD-binding protein, partial [Acidimicrobiales bacterium]
MDPRPNDAESIADDAESIAVDLRERLSASRVDVTHPLGAMTTYRVGGSAAVLVEVETQADLRSMATFVAERGFAVAVVGRGSNLLVADEGFDGIAIHLGESLADIGDSPDGLIRIAASASLPALARQLTAAGHSGFEWAVGVPGSAGGAVRMNAGGHGSDMAACVRSARLVDLQSAESLEWTARELGFAYRTSSVASHQVVVSVDLELAEGDPLVGQNARG